MSAHLKECSQCGGPNDLIASKCGFCHNDLPVVEEELDKLPDEKLIGTAGKWAALHVECIGNDFIAQAVKGLSSQSQRTAQRGILGNLKAAVVGDPDAKAVDGRVAQYTPEEIRINATRALSFLLSRVGRNGALMAVYSQLQHEIESAEQRRKTRMFLLLAGVAAFILLDIVIVIACALEGVFKSQPN